MIKRIKIKINRKINKRNNNNNNKLTQNNYIIKLKII